MNGGENRPAVFRIDVEFSGREVVLGITGKLNIRNAPQLEAKFDSMFDRGYDNLVLDLSELSTVDGYGLWVIANAARRMQSCGAAFVLRSPSAEIRTILDSNGLAPLMQLEWDSAERELVGPEEIAVVPDLRTSSTPGSQLRQNTASLNALSIERELLDDALHLVVNLARMSVGGADGVSVSLLRDGQIRTVAASDQTIVQMDASQYATREGPCLDASIEGKGVHVNSLDKETRWPAFIPMAQALGIRAILSNPLIARGRSVGAINIYSRGEAAFGPAEQQLAAAFANETSIVLSSPGLVMSDETQARRLQEALRSREVIAQAQGIMMERESISEDAAFDSLRRFSQHAARPLRERAEYIVASTQRQAFGEEQGSDEQTADNNE